MKQLSYLTLIIFSVLLTSCASKYKLLNPENSTFSSVSENDGIKVSYEYTKLRKKYAKKADKKDIKIIAVKVQNNTDKAITYGDNYKLITSGGEYLPILNSNDVYTEIKQKPGTHFWYLLLAPLNLNKTETTTDGYTTVTETKPIFPLGLILAPAISLGNYFTAKTANNKFENEVTKYSIVNKTIGAGESRVFLVPIRHSNYPVIKAKLN